MTDQAPVCPKCAARPIPIVYGMPDADLVAADAQGSALIGGVAIYPDSPEWHCPQCKHQWRVSPPASSPEQGLSADETNALERDLS